MKKHFYPPSAESMTVLTFRQMAACVAAFTALFIVAVFVVVKRPAEKDGKHQSVILGK
jgi:uncharacterized membrane protein YozB (DUF420 family)